MTSKENKLARRWDAILGYSTPSRQEEALRALLAEDFATPGEVKGWLQTVKEVFSAGEARLLQRQALEQSSFRKLTAQPGVLPELLPDVSAAALLLSRPVPKGSRKAAGALIDAWVQELLPELRTRLGGLSGTAGPVLDPGKTVRRNLHQYSPERRKLVVSRLYRKPKRSHLPPFVVILLDRSASMGEETLWTALCACALQGLPNVAARLFCFAEDLVELSALCGDPTELLLSLPAMGGTDLGGALAAVRPKIDTPSRTALFLLSDLRSEGDSALQNAAALLRDGVELRLVLPADPAAYAGDLARRLADLGAKMCPIERYICPIELFVKV